jgi:2-alkenal reductase
MLPRRFSFSTLLIVAVLTLLLGVFSGCMGGDDDNDDASDSGNAGSAAVTATANVQETSFQSTPEEDEATATSDQAQSSDDDDQDTPSQAEVLSVADLVEDVSPAVVTVINLQRFSGPFGNFGNQTDPQTAGTGTGFIISEDGYIVTNEHVVSGSDDVSVIFSDGTEVEAELIGTDPLTDLAVIKIDADVPGVVEMGDSTKMRPGDPVVAIGSALGEYTNTVTQGIVSGLGRQLPGDDSTLDNMIQHDAPINPGNSGGPLFNLDGEVIGVNRAVVRQGGIGVTAEGLGFAIPSETVKDIVATLIQDGTVERPFLGITYQQLTPRAAESLDLPVENGVVVVELSRGPAADAGVEVDDVITHINGEEINQDNSLVDLLFAFEPGDSVELTIYRPSTDETFTVDVTLGTRPANT